MAEFTLTPGFLPANLGVLHLVSVVYPSCSGQGPWGPTEPTAGVTGQLEKSLDHRAWCEDSGFPGSAQSPLGLWSLGTKRAHGSCVPLQVRGFRKEFSHTRGWPGQRNLWASQGCFFMQSGPCSWPCGWGLWRPLRHGGYGPPLHPWVCSWHAAPGEERMCVMLHHHLHYLLFWHSPFFLMDF